MRDMIRVEGLTKTFTMHTQNGARIPVFEGLSLTVGGGECVALAGDSGAGKSSLLCALYGNYRPQAGSVHVRHLGEWVDIVQAEPRRVLEVRRDTLGYVSQFLRVVPRVSALDIVAEARWRMDGDRTAAEKRARDLLRRLRIPERLWKLAPATFSGGEQQRVNIARTFVREYPVLLLDEPTASLDADNRDTVIELIREARDRGAAVVGIFHDLEVRAAVADRLFAMKALERAA